MTDHADLRAMLERKPEAYLISIPMCGVVMEWLKNAPALVRALLEERDKLAQCLKEQPETVPAALDKARAELDSLRNEVKMWRSTADSLKADRDQLAKQLADMRPRADVYVTAECHNEAMRALEQERDALKAEVERLRAEPAESGQIAGLREALAKIADYEHVDGCKAWDKGLNPGGVHCDCPVRIAADALEFAWAPTKPAEPISDELRLRCELAAEVFVNVVERGAGNDYSEAHIEWAGAISHVIAERLIAEGRRRMAAEREGKP